MKQKLFISLFLLISNISAYELEFSKSFNKSIQNDVVQTKISVIAESTELDYINKQIESFQKIIKKENNINISNGNFNQIPIYKYINKERTFSGYKGTLSYTIESNEYKTLDSFLAKLIKEQKKIKSNQVKLSISNTKWIVSKELYNQSIDEMRIESVSWIKDYSKKFSAHCMIENISINKTANFNPIIYKTNLSLEKTTKQVTPIQSEDSVSLLVNYKLECK